MTASLLADIAQRPGDTVLLTHADGHTTSLEGMFAAAANMARRLGELGVGPGDRLLVQAENSDQLLTFYVACALARIAACPLDPALPPARVAGLRTTIAPKMLIDAATLTTLAAPAADPMAALPGPDDAAEWMIIFSSGTTGEPKGIVHTQGSLMASAKSFAALSELGPESVIYHHFPMFYMAGIFNMFLCPLVAGARIVLGQKFSQMQMLSFWEEPRRHGVNHLTLTPTMALSLCQLYRRDDKLLDHLAQYQTIISTSSTLHPSVAERFHQTFAVPLRTCYGVTEIGGSITVQSWAEGLAFESCGAFSPETSIRAGSDANHPGEILVKTPFMMKGYLTRSGLSQPFDADGYFSTGDLGYVEDGRLFVTGRENDLVKKGGEFISLGLIENLALSLSQVAEVSVVAVPDDYWGNKIVLFYVPAAGVGMDEMENAAKDLFGANLRKIEIPDKLIAVPWFPKTSIGKTIKRDLVSRYTL
ncbi:class I adenylate-forming enzyme family protein [Magnetospirillum sulfuroxidans]|uniref:Acyl--CoA ligase n=1 Tax=Magnetospirillum sulfuroxidans TaxID=611300 RepID=A0ABS5ICD7_9PROT|nr:class I adenylate-forming enzyme family protein [Magnetospirillum sulfuroxidans]MBR9971343.1 acyl--CoA ligase [Magnetospirillum sulfuroxidans]